MCIALVRGDPFMPARALRVFLLAVQGLRLTRRIRLETTICARVLTAGLRKVEYWGGGELHAV
jgi:hypothetical protein